MLLRSLIVSAALLLLLVGCDMASQVKEGLDQSESAARAIEKQIGAKPEVGFNFNNGRLTTVTVQFRGAPNVQLGEIERASRIAVKSAFGKEPSNLVVAFVYETKPP